MDMIYNDIFLLHETEGHPENRGRLECIPDKETVEVLDGSEYLGFVHSQEYIKKVRQICEGGGGHLDADTMLSADSYAAATHAVGATLMACERGDFALVRPPGHHAYPDRGSGFCLFNNIAIAARKMEEEGQRVLIFDFDGHLGDGTEEIFYRSDRVLYCSIHQYPGFPSQGTVDQIGDGQGRGYSINLPLPPESGDDLFWKAFDFFLNIGKQFFPDCVGLSAGFDAHQFDPLLDLRLSTTTYYEIGCMVRKNFDRVFAVLEGGYNTEYLPQCIVNFLNGINEQEIAFSDEKTDSTMQVYDEFDHRLSDLAKNLSDIWKL